MSEHGVSTRIEGGVAVFTIDRPAVRNALSRATVRELGRLFRELRDDLSVRAVVLTATGDKAFCAGADLKERRSMNEEDVRDFLSLYRVAFDAIDRFPRPVIAALNGSAYGGGLELALACDLRVMDPSAVVGLTEVSLAIIPGAGGTQRLTRIVGPAKAKELILFAERMNAERALELGIVNWVAEEKGGALEFALEKAQHFAAAAPIAVSAALDAIDGATEMNLEEGLTWERRCYERTLASSDRLEALQAFKEKRAPIYKGE